MVDAGEGLAVPRPDGERWALATPDAVEVDGVRLPFPSVVQARSGCWWRDGVCVVRTDPRGGEPVSEVWWVTGAQGPVRLLTAAPGSRFFSVTAMGEDLFVKLYTDSDSHTAHTVRMLSLKGVDDAVNAVPDLSGSVHQVVTTSEHRRAALWSEDPNLTQHVLVEGDNGWETLTPELRLAGPCQRIDDRRLLIPAYDGIRIGMILLRLEDASWRWALRDPAASFLPSPSTSKGRSPP